MLQLGLFPLRVSDDHAVFIQNISKSVVIEIMTTDSCLHFVQPQKSSQRADHATIFHNGEKHSGHRRRRVAVKAKGKKSRTDKRPGVGQKPAEPPTFGPGDAYPSHPGGLDSVRHALQHQIVKKSMLSKTLPQKILLLSRVRTDDFLCLRHFTDDPVHHFIKGGYAERHILRVNLIVAANPRIIGLKRKIVIRHVEYGKSQ